MKKNLIAYVIDGKVTWVSPERAKQYALEFVSGGKTPGAYGKAAKPRRATTADIASQARHLATEERFASDGKPLTFGLFSSPELAALSVQLRKENTVDLIGAAK